MKLIASAHFANPKGWDILLKDAEGKILHLPKLDADGNQLKDEKGEPVYHTNHIHKGSEFNIGTGDTFAELDDAAKSKISQLAHCAIPIIEANKGLVKRVRDEVAADKKRDEVDAARAKAAAGANATAADILKALPALVATAVKAATSK